MAGIIKNLEQLATTPLRRDALTIAEAAYAAIDTERVIKDNMSLEGHTLKIDGASYDLSRFKSVKVIGFGKASCRAIQTIESLLKGYIKKGLAIDASPGVCEVVEVNQGSHPFPSKENVALSGKIVEMAGLGSAEDLFIVVVSGGGSSLLCWSMDECEQGMRLYEDFTRVGATYVSCTSLKPMEHDQVFLSIASDGIDNSEAAGALADKGTIERAAKAGLDVGACLEEYNTFPFFQATGDLFYTGRTDANVSDLFLYLHKI